MHPNGFVGLYGQTRQFQPLELVPGNSRASGGCRLTKAEKEAFWDYWVIAEHRLENSGHFI